MNFLLIDPFEVAKEYPETLTKHLTSGGHSRCIRFSKKGDYLALGLLDGTIVIFDMDTYQVIRKLQFHTNAVQSIQWLQCGRYLFSGSLDCNICLWDLDTGEVIRNYVFSSPVWLAQMHNKDIFQCVITLFNDEPVYINWADQANVKIIRFPKRDESVDDGDSTVIKNNVSSSKTLKKELILYATFGFDGKYIFTGSSRGFIDVMEIEDDLKFSVIFSQKVSNTGVKQIIICEKIRKIFCNCSDRVIRQLSINDSFNSDSVLELELKYQDVINRLQWNNIMINHNGEYLIASTFGSGAHDVYMWETTMGSLVKVLEGVKEELFDIDWNNKRCIIGANGLDSGFIYLWSNVLPQKWSALAPDFIEVEENIEYDEREDEFDIVEEEELNQLQMDKEDEIIDVITKDEMDARGLVEEESFIIPIILETEI